MTPEQWLRAERLYLEAAGIAVRDRASWLARACDGDEVVQREVESLLAQDASATGALDGHALDHLIEAPVDDSLVGRQLGGYEFLSLIDEGGMGQVYRARDLALPREVAVKVVSPQFTNDPVRRARFRQEAEMLAAFAHPHIAHIYAFVEAEGRFLLAMELVPGETLADRIARGPLTLNQAIAIAKQVADALDAAHEQGVIHRDLKPANIRITPEGVVKVLDFGLATVVRSASSVAGTVTRTAPGMLLGTIGYMSPEQARGESVDKRTDIWAFGCLLFEMLTGSRAFAGSTTSDTLAAILERDPDWSRLRSGLPVPLITLLRRCLDKDRKRRLRDIGEARIALDAPSEAATPASPQRWRVASVILVAIGVIGLAVWGYRYYAPFPEMERVEFPVFPPPGVVWGELPPEPVARVAPNGERIVFNGRAQAVEGDSVALWVRDLGDQSARFLTGSNDYLGNTQAPFWSPDSQTIAYCTDSQSAIKKISVDGRSAEQIAVGCNGDGSWNARGEILYKAPGGLFLVGENGGQPKQITVSNDTQTDDHRHPRFLPDGTRFLFTQRSQSAEKAGIYLGRTNATATVRLLADASMAEYVETVDGSSYLFFVRTADLIAQRVDGATLSPTGDAVVVARGLGMGLSRLPSFSVTPKLLAYRNNVVRSTYVWTDRHGTATGGRYGGTTSLGVAALSHDERTLAFGRLNPDTNFYELWSLDVATGIQQKVHSASTILAAPSFSPDDRRLVFTAGNVAFLKTLGKSDVTEANPYPRTPDCVARGSCPSSYVTDWSMDGKYIIQTGKVAWFAPGQTTPPTPIGTIGLHAKLTRDGQWLAYTSNEASKPEVFVQHFPDGERRTRVSADGGFQPFWRADGRELFYRNDLGDIMAVEVRLGEQVQVVRSERLFREQFRPGGDDFARRDFIVSADGQRFLLNLPASGMIPVTVVRNWVNGLGR